MSKRVALVILVILLVVAAGVRSYALTARSLWFDEAFSWRLIQFPLDDMLTRAAADVHPPLYYVLLKGWSIVFGTSLLSLRSLSVVAGVGAVAATYLFTASAARSRTTGLLAATLLTLAGWQIQFAWEARMYTVGCVLALLSSWALLKAIRAHAHRLLWWLAYGVLASLFAYTHYYAFFTLAAHNIFIVGYLIYTTRGRLGEILQARRFWYSLLAALTATALYSPWLPRLWEQNSRVQSNYWIAPIGGWSIPDTFYRMFIPTTGIPRHDGMGWIVVALLPVLLTGALWLFVALRGRTLTIPQDARWLITLLGITPFILSIAISLVSQSLYQDRFFIFAHLFILIALAVAINSIPWPLLRRAFIVLTVVGLTVTSLRFWQQINITQKPGAHGATQYIFAHNVAHDPILVSSPFVYFAILHYSEEEFAGSYRPYLYSETDSLSHFAGGPILTPDDIAGPTILTSTTRSVWVVDTTGFGATPLTMPVSWLTVDHQSFPEVFFYQGDVHVTKYQAN